MGGLGQQLKGVILYVSLCARQRFFKESAIRFLQNAKKDGRTAEKGIQDQFSDFFGRQRCKKHGYAKRKRIYRL